MKKLIPNILLIFFGLLLATLMLEIILRTFFYKEYRYERYLYTAHSELGFRLSPNSTGKTVFRDFTYHTKTNSKGLREDREYQYEKGPGVYRIIFLGDSMTFGCVEKDRSYEDIFERFYSDKFPGQIEVINISAPGYGTYHEAILLKEEGVKYQPDKVILFFCLNDFEDNILGKGLATVLYGYRIRTGGKEASLGFRIKTFLKIHILSYRLVSERFHILKKKFHSTKLKDEKALVDNMYYKILSGNFTDPEVKQGREKTESLILEINSILKLNRIDFEVVIIPSRYHIYKEDKIRLESRLGHSIEPTEVNNMLTTFLLQHGIAYYDLTYDLLKQRREFKEPFYYKTDEHFNELGNKVVADLLIKHYDRSIKEHIPNSQ